jgi:hypothetical protein
MAVNALGMTDDVLSDAFERKTKEPRVQVAEATSATASDAGGGQQPAPVPSEREKKAGFESEKERILAEEAKRKKSESEAKSAADKARQAAIYEEYKPELTKKFQPFEAPKESFSSLAGIGMMLMAVGSMGGKKGLTSATGAMNAIAGMATGYQQGRKEEFDRQKAIFDENYKIMKDNQAQIEKEFQYALKYAKTDLTGAANYLKQQAIARGDKGFAAEVDKNGPVVAIGKQTSAVRSGLTKAENDVLELNKQIRLSEAKIADQEKKKTARPITVLDAENKPYLADPITRQPILDDYGNVMRPGTAASIKAQGGVSGGEASPNSLQFRYNNAVSGATLRLATSLENVTSLPTFAKAPGLSEMISDPAKGITGPMERYLAQKTTSEEDRAWQQESARVLRAATSIEGQGRPGGQTAGALAEYSKELAKPNDSRINKVLSMALLKQEFDFAVAELKVSGASKSQIQLAEESKAKIDSLIPYSVSDINRILRGGKSSLASSVDKTLLDSITSTKDFDKRVKILERVKDIPVDAKEMLLNNPTPEARKQFDEIFGKDASLAVIGR